MHVHSRLLMEGVYYKMRRNGVGRISNVEKVGRKNSLLYVLVTADIRQLLFPNIVTACYIESACFRSAALYRTPLALALFRWSSRSSLAADNLLPLV